MDGKEMADFLSVSKQLVIEREKTAKLQAEMERLHEAIYDVLTDCEHLDEARAMLVVALPKELKGGE